MPENYDMTWFWALPSPYICLAMVTSTNGKRMYEVVFDAKLHVFAFGVSDEFSERRLKELFDQQGVAYEVTH